MTPDNAWLYAALPFITMAVLSFGLVVLFRQRAATRRVAARPALASPPAPPRPWWANPWLWLAVCACSLVLGYVVWPGLFGSMLIVLPLVWIRRTRKPPQIDPRSNGHSHRGEGVFRPE